MATNAELEKEISLLKEQIKILGISTKSSESNLKEVFINVAQNQEDVSQLSREVRANSLKIQNLERDFEKFKKDTEKHLNDIDEQIGILNKTMQEEVLPEVKPLKQLGTSLGTPGGSSSTFSGSDPHGAFRNLNGIVTSK